MGYAKYHEDDFNIVCERLFSKTVLKSKKDFIRLLKCPYCQENFDNKNSLFSHIKLTHNIDHPVVFVNGMVAKDCVYVSDIKSAIVHLFGFNDNVLLDGKNCLSSIDEYGILDITDSISKQFFKEGQCVLTVGNINVSIKRYSLHAVNQDLLSEYINAWDSMLRKGSLLSMNINKDDDLNPAEKYYLEGIFNYFVACQANGKEKNDRYNEANSILSKFIPVNSLGLCIQKINAFRLNWVHVLKSLCNQYETYDDFNMICDFFEDKPSDDMEMLSDNVRHLYIEDELLNVFDAIVCFQKKEYDEVNRFLTSHDEKTINDDNLADKVYLLKSRMKMIEGKKSEANFYRKEIISDGFKFTK